MRRLLAFSMTAALLTMGAGLPARAHTASRVIVSATLNDTLLTFDAETLDALEPPVISKGPGPVRLWIERIGGTDYLFTGNHGAAGGSVGVFDLSGPALAELPASPFPTGPGTVGITAGTAHIGEEDIPVVLATNTWFALGGCGMPAGSLSVLDASLLTTAGVLAPIATVPLSGSIPYAVSLDGADGLAFASTNCGNSLDTISLTATNLGGTPAPAAARIAAVNEGSRATGAGPDGLAFDADAALNYTANISGSSVSVHAPTGAAATTVPLAASAHPVELTLATGPSGERWVLTANGGNDTISVIDRGVVEACVVAVAASCPAAVVAQIPTGVLGGAPEGVAFDPVSQRAFVVNKPIGGPSLSVLALSVSEGVVSGTPVGAIPLTALGDAVDSIPAVIAFDVIVQTR